MPDEIRIRSLEAADLPQALTIQAANYPAFLWEDEAAFASRLDVASSYCLAAERDGVLVGYLLAHGWVSESPPPIGTILDKTIVGDVLFIHDLAVAPAGQGAGLGRRLIDQAFARAAADGFGRAELIAVEGAAPYWRGLGFADGSALPELAAKVAAYGAEARWMTRAIGGLDA